MTSTCYSTIKVTYSRFKRTMGGAQTPSKGKNFHCFNQLMDIRPHLIWNALLLSKHMHLQSV